MKKISKNKLFNKKIISQNKKFIIFFFHYYSLSTLKNILLELKQLKNN
jgi:hypothetical protein